MLSRNPYKLATDIYGIGFNTADRIAEKLGFDKSAPARAEAGILYVFNQLSNEGHVYYPYELLIEKCKEILEVDREVITEAIDHITREGKIAIEDLGQDFDKSEANQKGVYLAQFHSSETCIANHLGRLLVSQKNIHKVIADKAIQWV